MATPYYHDSSVRELVDLLAEETPAPAGGSAAALAVELAAALLAMAASFSRPHWTGASAALGQARALRARVGPLVEADAEVYGSVLAALRAPRDEPGRDLRMAKALSDAADVPLRVTEAAAEIAELAAQVAIHGNPNLRGDAIAAALLAEAGARTGAYLVAINLADQAGDERVARSEALASRAGAAASQAGASGL